MKGQTKLVAAIFASAFALSGCAYANNDHDHHKIAHNSDHAGMTAAEREALKNVYFIVEIPVGRVY